MNRHSAALPVSVALAALSSGCFWFTSKQEGVELRRDVKDLQALASANQQRSTEVAKNLDIESHRLHEIIDRATNVLERNSADVGDTVQKLLLDMATLMGKLDELQRSNDAVTKQFQEYRAATDTKLEQLTNELTKVEHPPIPETADGIWSEATRFQAAGQQADARRLYEAFVTRYPNDPRAARAQIGIGDSYVSEQRWANAVGAYTRVLDNFPKSEAVDDAMFANAGAFFALKYCTDAKTFLTEELKRYPKTAHRKDIDKQLKAIGAAAKNKAVCSS